MMAGKKALGAWFQQCRLNVDDVGIGTFKKLMTLLLKTSVLLRSMPWPATSACSRSANAEAATSPFLSALRNGDVAASAWHRPQ